MAGLRRLLGRSKTQEAPISDDAPGWDAIDNAFRGLYGPKPPVHQAMVPGLAFGSPLQGISAYRAEPHWHFVTYGLSELWSKDPNSNPAISGWGYELTMRARGDVTEPPAWPFGILAGLAQVTLESGQVHLPGDRIALPNQQPFPDGMLLEAVAVTTDGMLPERLTANGTLAFHQLVKVTAAELERMKEVGTETVLNQLRNGNPLLIS